MRCTSTLNWLDAIGSGLSRFWSWPDSICLLISWLTDFVVGAFPKYSVPNLFFPFCLPLAGRFWLPGFWPAGFAFTGRRKRCPEEFDFSVLLKSLLKVTAYIVPTKLQKLLCVPASEVTSCSSFQLWRSILSEPGI